MFELMKWVKYIYKYKQLLISQNNCLLDKNMSDVALELPSFDYI